MSGAAALLTLVERKSRKLIIRKIKDKTPAAVSRAINGMNAPWARRRSQGRVRKSITADNGSEFLDSAALEASEFGSSARTHLYYAHPYSSRERGSNENTNRMIRRFIPKGSDITKCTRTAIQEIENWINRYPRKILNFKTAEELFIQEIAA
ncbi:IS30 family transposase [Pontiella sulfatireligans]|uniref:Integrase catalytic domain-containing protein n=1 Tax=Pontiella sulfatireligans TaxID=2750658 RepID=A0A6C2USM6_9BACT|nr:IS30 family transposase [Pontiella sulfatireligans]VGO22953.1 hypothetical protein SCARR_05052 [Pontiella sulfatireligans]